MGSKMLVSILGMCLAALTNGCERQEKKTNPCANFRTGKFRYAGEEHNDWKIIRNDSIQTEVNKKTGVRITCSIEWTSDCEYQLTYLEVKTLLGSKHQKKDTKSVIEEKVYVQIEEVIDNGYICHSRSGFVNTKVKMIKVDKLFY